MDILYYTQATAGDGRGGWVSGVDGALKVESFPRRRRWVWPSRAGAGAS